ncbi:hypothetical protein Taro_025738 [Colocasia esculenta]|uniref:Uncharacterized protein n=1 Tax=Colocasia esculenta TaxID=4460 RepID=A0A843VHF6_COLES|nr:hypothetical protein [Colocasia esculenta]
MYRIDGRNENYDNASEVLIGAKNVIKHILHNEYRAIIAFKQMHNYRLQFYHFGTNTAQRAAQILSPGELDDVSLLPEFETPPTPKRQKKVMGARVRSKQQGISIADLETIEEDNDDETPEPSDNLDTTKGREATWHILNTRMHRATPEAEHMHNPRSHIRIHMTHESYGSYQGADPTPIGSVETGLRSADPIDLGPADPGPIPEFLNLD